MTVRTTREIAADPSSIFAAFADPSRLRNWWGPAGFTNTFEVCEFEPGGKWTLVMHGPDGRNYPNESIFSEIEPSKRIVIDHISQPKYVLTITLEPTSSGTTLVHWHQTFENPRVVARLTRTTESGETIVPPNEENLDRLTAEVLRVRAE
ncbi:SRPBCC domain-containing protein [Nocardia wallacei]|uniref:SRPBCC domain-containing protein n=1 Tax=Nocardia wallacei TaxID=480035 RepID=UPI002457B709|nr:SRPBCC domain-containing protein [Nocardia wallacei]